MKLFTLIMLLWLNFSSFAHASIAQYTIRSTDQSLRDEPKQNIKQYLAQLELKSTDNANYIKQQVAKQARLAMQALGYYHGVAVVSLDPTTTLDITVDIALGYATLMAQSDFILTGAAQSDPDFMALHAAFPIVVGAKFHHGTFEDNKNRFNQLAQAKGYFDGHWIVSEVRIDLVTNQAFLVQIFDSGVRYRFGNTLIPSLHAATQLIEAMVPYRAGDFYHSDQLAQFNFALNQSQYFASAQAIPSKPDVTTGFIDIAVSLIDKPKNMVELSVGYSTDTLERASVKWTKPWLNQHGHSLVTKANFSQEDQYFTTDYRIPHGDPNNDYTSVVLGWQDLNNDEQDYEKYSLQWQRHQPIDINWQRTLFVKYEREYNRIDDITSDLVIPGVSYSRTRRRGRIATYWGDRQLYSLEAANKVWGSSSDLIKLSIHSNWLRQYQDTHQLLLKFAFGAISADTIDDVPNSLRFYSGGDDNLRAYDYKSVAPLHLTDNELVARGGLYQALASVEYSYPIIDHWRLATFYDVGTTTDDFSESLKSNIGVGVRWQTPVGPIRLDLAWGLKSHDIAAYDHPFRISFSIGVNL